MKYHHFILLFLAIFIAFGNLYQVKQNTLEKISVQKNRYDSILETAVDDAAECLVKLDRGRQPAVYKEDALDVFFKSLYAGFGISQDKEAQEEIKRYFPVIMVTDRNGCYFWHHGEYGTQGEKLTERWSEKYPFAYDYVPSGASSTGLYLTFTTENQLYAMDKKSYHPVLTTREDLLKEHPGYDFLQTKEAFEELKNAVFIDTITKYMNIYIQKYNKIGRHYEIFYQFSLPYLNDSQWARTTQDITFLAVFQGYPYGNFTTETYNRVEIGGARVRKSDSYYITEKNGDKQYHTMQCEEYHTGLIPYDSKRECALAGAWPCRKCRP